MSYCENFNKKGKNFIQLSKRDVFKLEAAIRKDVQFLKLLGLMDYSLLIVIEEKEQNFSQS